MASKASDEKAKGTDEAKGEEDALALPEKTKKTAVRLLVFGIFQAVLQHVLALQSDVSLISRAVADDQAAASRCLATSQAISGVVGLFLNQVGGKLSDSLGRKLFFLVGPLANILGSMAVLRRSTSVATLMVVRILKSCFITFSGTVMCQAALADLDMPRQEGALINTRIQAAVGVAVIAGPYIESLILKVSKGDARSPFKAIIAFSLVQLVTNGLFLPETLVKKKRADIASFFESLSSLNPFNFLKIYRGENSLLKKLLTIQTFQYCVDGKVTSDLFQMWSKNNLQWNPANARDFVAFWGAAVTAGGAFVHPYLLRRLSTYAYSSLGNISVWIGLTMHGLMEKGLFMWGGVPFLVPGVNGGSAHAIKALSVDIAAEEGYGNGEFAAWANNMRALAQSIDIVFLGMWYAWCKERGLYQGSTWFLAGFIGAGIPQLLMSNLRRSELERSK